MEELHSNGTQISSGNEQVRFVSRVSAVYTRLEAEKFVKKTPCLTWAYLSGRNITKIKVELEGPMCFHNSISTHLERQFMCCMKININKTNLSFVFF